MIDIDFFRMLGGSILPLTVGAIAGYSAKRFWVAAAIAAAFCCFLSVAPIDVRIGAALICVSVVGLVALIKKNLGPK